jgi:hypothetical protein
MNFGRTMEKSTYFLVTLFSLALGAVRADETVYTDKSTTSNGQVATLRKKSTGIDVASGQTHRIVLLEQQMKEVYTDTVRDTFGAKAAAARPQLDNNYHLYLSGDALFWQAFEGGNDYAYVTNTQGPSFKGNSQWLNFDWSWGYRTEIGYRTSHDNWDLALHYTWFYDKADSHVGAPAGGEVVPLFYQAFPLNIGNFAKSSLRLHFYDADLALQKSYFLSSEFSLTSLAALRTTWIAQKAHSFTSYSSVDTPQTVSQTGHNNFWGIGPKVGIAPKWFISPNWNFFGQFAGSILYGEFDVRAKALEDGVLTIHLNDKLHQIVPTIQGALGFGWEMNSFCNHYHIALNLAYEAQYWWRQNQLISYLPNGASTQILKRLGEDLGLHGLIINALFDF